MQPVVIKEKKFTYTRITSKMKEGDYHNFTEVEESQVAHVAFVSRGQEGLSVQFFMLSPDGKSFNPVKHVERIMEIDGGKEVED